MCVCVLLCSCYPFAIHNYTWITHVAIEIRVFFSSSKLFWICAYFFRFCLFVLVYFIQLYYTALCHRTLFAQRVYTQQLIKWNGIDELHQYIALMSRPVVFVLRLAGWLTGVLSAHSNAVDRFLYWIHIVCICTNRFIHIYMMVCFLQDVAYSMLVHFCMQCSQHYITEISSDLSRERRKKTIPQIFVEVRTLFRVARRKTKQKIISISLFYRTHICIIWMYIVCFILYRPLIILFHIISIDAAISSHHNVKCFEF